MFQTKVVGNINAQSLSLILFPENCALYETMWTVKQ
jgi:hypothetical protein